MEGHVCLSEVRRRRGVALFAHPGIAVAVTIWLVNDHVLKDRFASWWTGKLSDVVGLIVFPLLLATIAERWLDRPLRAATVFTALFFGSINTVTAADAFTEWALGIFLGPINLTVDPTDLLVLPALAGAQWFWHRDITPYTIRRSWGRVVFCAAIWTVVATSDSEFMSETFEGTAWLTAESPEVVLPLTLTIDGEQAEDLTSLVITTDALSYGASGNTDNLLTVERLLDEDGVGSVRIWLTDSTAAPVEVRWSVVATSGGDEGPVLGIELPPDSSGPPPLLEVANAGTRGEWQTHRVVIESSPDGLARFVAPDELAPAFRVVTEDEQQNLDETSTTSSIDLRPPERCALSDIDTCRYEVFILNNNFTFADIAFIIIGVEGEVSLVEHTSPGLEWATIASGTATGYVFDDSETRIEVPVQVDVSLPDDPAVQRTTVLQFEATAPRASLRTIPPHTAFGDEGLFYWNAPECCDLTVQLFTRFDDDGDFPAEVEFDWTATVWSSQPIAQEDVTVTIG